MRRTALHCIALTHGLGGRVAGLGDIADWIYHCVLGSWFWSPWVGVGIRSGRYTAFVQALWETWVLAWHGFSLCSCTCGLHAGGSGFLLSRW